MPRRYSAEQQQAIEAFQLYRVVVISGPPGSGKTTLIHALLEKADAEAAAMQGKKRGRRAASKVLLCAPTGTAAERLRETSKRVAHVVMKVDFSKKLIERFKGGIIVVDEASMLTSEWLWRVLKDLKPCKLVLIGDHHQLPPVGDSVFPALNTLRHVSWIPRVNLKGNFRHHTNHATLLGKCLETLGTDAFVLEHGDETFEVKAFNSDEEAIQHAAKLYRKSKGAMQMLSFTNERVERMWKETQTDKPLVHGMVRQGDIVVCMDNVYNGARMLVANGTTGVAFDDMTIVYNGTKFTDVRKDKSTPFRTTFVPFRCCTVHKAQGKEFDEGVVILTNWTGELELLYTALSRFRKRVVVVGTPDQIRRVFSGKFKDRVDEDLIVQMEAMAKAPVPVPPPPPVAPPPNPNKRVRVS